MKNTFGYVNESDFIDEENEIDVKETASTNQWDENQENIGSSFGQDFHEISLYDPCKCMDENFEDGSSQKYLLVRVNNSGGLDIERKIPDQFSKTVVDMNKMTEYDTPEFIV